MIGRIGELTKFSKSSSFMPEGFVWPHDTVVLFPPADDAHGALMHVLTFPCLSVKVNMYGYDDDEIDARLHDLAASPSLAFQMSLDKTQAGGAHEKALLAPWSKALGTTVAVGSSARHAISHLKVMVIDGLYVISGSTNWSKSGEGEQDNELIIRANPRLAALYSATLDFNHATMLAQMRRAGWRK